MGHQQADKHLHCESLRRKKGAERMFEDIKTENSNFMGDMSINIQEAQRNPTETHYNQTSQRKTHRLLKAEGISES